MLAPSGYDGTHHEKLTISSYNNITGVTTLTEPVKFKHFGSARGEIDGDYEYDLRSEVGLLSRNIKIQGSKEENWGGQIFVT